MEEVLMTDTLIDSNTFVVLDEDWEIECDHRGHNGVVASTISDRMHGGPAKYWVMGPCPQANGFRCAVFYEWAQHETALGKRYQCCYCNFIHSWIESIFTPIGKASS